MSSNKRNFTGSVSIRIEDTRTKIDLAPAEEYGGEEGIFRVRIGRRWLDSPDGHKLFFDKLRLAELVAGHVFADAVAMLPETPPDIPRSSRVSIKFWHNNKFHSEGVFTSSPPYRGFDGRFYVWVMTYAAGFISVPVENVTVIKPKRSIQDDGNEKTKK